MPGVPAQREEGGEATLSKLPGFYFYPGEWLKDPELRSCSPAARGIWFDIICLMSQCKPPGKLVTRGVAWDEERIARALGGTDKEVTGAIEELKKNGVLRRNNRGYFYSKRLLAIARERGKWRKRQKKHRDTDSECHGNVTSKSLRSSGSVSGSKVLSQNLKAAPVCGKVENLKAGAEKQISDAQEELRVNPESRGARLAFDEGMEKLRAALAPVAARRTL